MFEQLPDLRSVWKTILPYLCSVVAFFLQITLTELPFFGPVRLSLILYFVYYWSIYQPRYFPPSLGLIIGLFLDSIYQMPIGLNAVLLIGIHILIRQQNRLLLNQTFWIHWLCFAFILLGYETLIWSILSLMEWRMMPIENLVKNCALTLILFPFAKFMAYKIHSYISKP